MNGSGNGKRSFTFFSQNTQGHRGDVHTSVISKINSGKMDVALLQESGTPNIDFKPVGKEKGLFSGTIESQSNRRTRNSGKKVHALHFDFKGSKGGNSRTSMTMLSKFKPNKMGLVRTRHKNLRPMMYMQFDDYVVANLHLPSGKARFAGKVLHELLEDLDGEFKRKKIKTDKVLVLGDLNMDGTRAKNTAGTHNFTAFSPSGPTHQGGNTLDHVLTRGGTVSKVRTGFTSSDHSGLTGEFKL